MQGSLDEAEVVQVQVQWRVEPLDVDVVVDLVVVRCEVMWMPLPMMFLGAAVAATVVSALWASFCVVWEPIYVVVWVVVMPFVAVVLVPLTD